MVHTAVTAFRYTTLPTTVSSIIEGYREARVRKRRMREAEEREERDIHRRKEEIEKEQEMMKNGQSVAQNTHGSSSSLQAKDSDSNDDTDDTDGSDESDDNGNGVNSAAETQRIAEAHQHTTITDAINNVVNTLAPLPRLISLPLPLAIPTTAKREPLEA
jgi:uncharacterized protein with von Willebrand factor type A (vWA) domain